MAIFSGHDSKKNIGMKYLLKFALLTCLLSCSPKTETDNHSIEQWKNEIMETELNFAKMAKAEGIKEAFLHYAAHDAVLLRNRKLVAGKPAIQSYFENQPFDPTASLSWKPDFVEVANSGDLGYTYGQFTFSFIDSTGQTIENKGIFHTVWKRQPDGTWKYVWD